MLLRNNSAQLAIFFASSQEFKSFFDEIRGSLIRIAWAVELHGTVALLIGVFENAEGPRHVYMN
jgi:hypothetical protein